MTKIFGEEVLDMSLDIIKGGIKTFISFVNGHQKVVSAEMDFNEPVDRMIHSVGISQCFLQLLLSLPSGFINRMVNSRVMHRLSSMDSHSPRLSWL